MIANESGLEPLGVAVLLRPYMPERVAGKIVIHETVQGREAMVDNRAVIVAIVKNAWHDEPSPRAQVGDKVLVTQFAEYAVVQPQGALASLSTIKPTLS